MSSPGWTPVDESAWSSVDESTGTPPPAGNVIRPADTGPKAYAESLMSDIQSGTAITPVGRFLRSLGAQGTRSGVSEATGAMVGGPLEGIPRAVHGFLRTQQSRAGLPGDVAGGLNEMLAGAGQTIAPIAGATNPEFLPMAARFGIGQAAGEKVAGALGAGPEAAQLTGNIAGMGALATPSLSGKTPVGIRSRASAALNQVEAQIGDNGIDYGPALNRAFKAFEMNAKGFAMPPAVARFVEWVQAVKASRTPFRFQDARDFYTSLGEAIPWDQFGGKGGKMYSQVKAMRAELGKALQSTADQAGLGDTYAKGLQDYSKSMGIVKGAKNVGSALTAGPIGKAFGLSGGDLAAYLARKAVNAKAPGEAGSMVQSVLPPETDIEMATRRGPGEAPDIAGQVREALMLQRKPTGLATSQNPETFSMADIQARRPELFKPSAGNPTVSAEPQWPEGYGTPNLQPGQNPTGTGAGGANFTEQQMADYIANLKKQGKL